MKLYKYTNLKYIPSCIENGIYASKLDMINDPYEGKGIKYPNQYRVVCLTSSSHKMLMWAYYCNHRGCCIEFEVDKNVGIQKVDYTKDFVAHENMNTHEVIESLYKKGYEWRKENEYRLVFHKSVKNNEVWKNIENDYYLKASVSKIIFGFAAEYDNEYYNMLKYLLEYNKTHESKIFVTKCKLHDNQYRLIDDKQFDIRAELELF